MNHPEKPVKKKSLGVQDSMLNALCQQRIPVSIYLVNGIKLQGEVESFDQFVVVLRGHISQMLFKHAISTIVPSRDVEWKEREIEDKPEPKAQPKLEPIAAPGAIPEVDSKSDIQPGQPTAETPPDVPEPPRSRLARKKKIG